MLLTSSFPFITHILTSFSGECHTSRRCSLKSLRLMLYTIFLQKRKWDEKCPLVCIRKCATESIKIQLDNHKMVTCHLNVERKPVFEDLYINKCDIASQSNIFDLKFHIDRTWNQCSIEFSGILQAFCWTLFRLLFAVFLSCVQCTESGRHWSFGINIALYSLPVAITRQTTHFLCGYFAFINQPQ